MKHVLILLLVAFGISCSPTNTVTMSVQEPPVLQLPSSIEQIGLINRSDTGAQSYTIERFARVLSAEGQNLDVDGATESITGLAEEIQQYELFDAIKTPEISQLDNSAFGAFPAPLSWKEVSEICNEYDLDGLFSLEFYNTDSRINYNPKRLAVKGLSGVEIPIIEHHATVFTTIKTGWRIYDNDSGIILDEFVTTENVVNTGQGVSPVEAVAAITGRNEVVNDVSREIGRFYARRVVPHWVSVTRDYYVKGSDNLERAKRRVQTGNWDGAAELWMKDIDHPNSKVAGRAHYNMAIINEINDNMDDAIKWARISYEDYGDKKALDYVRILEQRKARLATMEQ